MKREFRNPVWQNKHKESVICKIAIIDDDGNETVHNGQISRLSDSENINPDWEVLLSEYSLEDIDKLTEEFDNEQKERIEKDRQIHEEEKKRQKERKKQEELFETKLQLFEIPDVKESTNRAIKSKIRKANTELEAVVHAARLIVQNEINEEPESDSSE